MAIITDGVKTKFTDDLGLPLIGGKVFSYEVGTSTPKDTYIDRALTIPNTNPIILDDGGSCQMYLKGGYRLRVLTADNVLVEEKDNAFQSDGQVLDVVANTAAIAALKLNVDTLNTRGGLKLDENNHIVGQGKAESATVYALSLRSDKVRVSAPTATDFGDLIFKTYAVPTVVNGVTIPAGTWLNPALVTPLLGTAATKNVGTATGNVLAVGTAFGLGSTTQAIASRASINRTKLPDHSMTVFRMPSDNSIHGSSGLAVNTTGGTGFLLNNYGANNPLVYTHLSNMGYDGDGKVTNVATVGDVLIRGINATLDSNGFLKGASPIAEIYSDKMDLNQDATQQGGITFEKLGVGDYLVKGSLGFAQDGWHVETPKDANGNVLVAVVEKQLANNDLSIKTYAKRFDDETGDIVPNLLKPRDIPDGRFISLRLHELPKEPPVMPVETTTP